MKMLALLMLMVDGGSGETPEVQLLDFSASYCQPCKQMVPVIQAMERDGFPVRQIDITEEHELARRFQVDRVPTLVLLVEGKEAKRFVGLTSAAELRREMNAAAKKLAESRGNQPMNDAPALQPDAIVNNPDQPSAGGNVEESSADPGHGRPSMGEKLRSLLGGEKKATPTVRAQSPETDAQLALLKRAYAATVRVKVTGTREKDGLTVQDVGTGTIVNSSKGESVVLTCAHLFLGISRKDTKVVIEVFENGKATAYPGSVLGGNHDSDIAFLKFQTSKALPAVPLTLQSPGTAIGETLMSFGCNDGADPTPLQTKLIAINRYNGPDNLVCEKDPAGGRSGGGLFNKNGELVAICSCADRKRKEGLYMAHTSVLKLAEKLQLTSILGSKDSAVALVGGEDAADVFSEMMAGGEPTSSPTNESVAQSQPSSETAGDSFDSMFGSSEFADSGTSPAENHKDAKGLSVSNELAPKETPASESMEPEVVIEIADRTQGGKKRRVVIPKASPWLLEMLTGDDAGSASTAKIRPESIRETTSARTSPVNAKRSTILAN